MNNTQYSQKIFFFIFSQQKIGKNINKKETFLKKQYNSIVMFLEEKKSYLFLT